MVWFSITANQDCLGQQQQKVPLTNQQEETDHKLDCEVQKLVDPGN